MPTKSLPSSPSLDHLKHQAKDLLKACREHDPEAFARIREFHPKFGRTTQATPAETRFSLADAQLVIAREYGFESWPKLKRHLESDSSVPPSAPRAAESLDALVARFLEYACPDHHVRGGPAHVIARHAAVRLLEQHPEITSHSLFTAVVCGELETVQRLLAETPAAAREKFSAAGSDRSGAGGSDDIYKDNGPKLWEPLLFLCFTRLPIAAVDQNAVAIARALLDHGADPNAFFMAGDSRYTPLVGVVGEGEENRPPHPQRDALARLLLERGTEPYDMQVVYDINFNGDILWFMKLMHEHAVRHGRKSDWEDPNWPMLDMGGYGCGARWHMEIAIKHNNVELAEWLLAHGANPNAAPARDRRFSKRSLYEEARYNGRSEIADLLARYGAATTTAALRGEEAFMAACMSLDRERATKLLEQHPEYLRSSSVMFAAAKQDRPEVVVFLLDLGMSPDMTDFSRQTALHLAAYHGSVRVVELLIERGATIDAVDSMHDGTPLWWAVWGNRQRTADLLSRFSKDVWALSFTGNVERLRALLTAEPVLARSAGRKTTPLMWLPGDEAKAIEIVRLFLAHGADATARNAEGLTAADLARKRGLDSAADLLSNPPATNPGELLSTSEPDHFEKVAKDLVMVYESGDAAALQRLNQHRGRSSTWDDVRADIWHSVYKVRQAKGRPDSFTVADAQEFLAHEAGHPNWNVFVKAGGKPPAGDPFAIDGTRISPRRSLSDREWEILAATMKERLITELHANGQVTDAALKRIAELDHVTQLNLDGSQQLTDEGLGHLARMRQLRHLDVSNYPGSRITDRGLEVLRHLPELRSFKICWQPGITDAGVANLRFCEKIEDVNLMGTQTGDGIIQALAGKRTLRHLKTGRLVSDAGLPFLHQIPVFKECARNEVNFDIRSPESSPNSLLLDGPFTNDGLAALAGLDGLFGLDLFWHTSALTSDGLKALSRLPMLGSLGCDGKLCDDTAMKHIAGIPRLRMLRAQGTVASDDGFIALSASRTLEGLWGRECPNLTGRGFAALSTMPALRQLGVSCRNVDDASLASLPRFPSLQQLTPIDVNDDGFRHVGKCMKLERLLCMYCRETTDVATEHIAGLPKLKSYYAGLTRITDRSLEILGRIPSLEEIEFYECKEITDTGLPFLARLPHLREIDLAGCPNVTLQGTKVFPASVRVKYSV